MQTIKQSVLDIVNARYEILEIIDLVQYDYQLDKLDQLLSKYNDYTFLNNQRIIILHHDTDYYISNNSQGFTIFNLCILLNRYQIPHEFLIMFTNHYGIENEIAQLSSQICNCRPFKIIYTSQWYDYPDSESINNSQVVSIKNLFCCLNGVNRAHRLLTLCYLKKNNLFNLGTISYHFNQ
jgi:hypothetical protein